MEVRPEHPRNAFSPILVTLLGIIVFLHPVIKLFDEVSIIALQFSRESYMELPLSTLMEVRPRHAKNAYFPIVVTLLGIVMEVRPSQ